MVIHSRHGDTNPPVFSPAGPKLNGQDVYGLPPRAERANSDTRSAVIAVARLTIIAVARLTIVAVARLTVITLRIIGTIGAPRVVASPKTVADQADILKTLIG